MTRPARSQTDETASRSEIAQHLMDPLIHRLHVLTEVLQLRAHRLDLPAHMNGPAPDGGHNRTQHRHGRYDNVVHASDSGVSAATSYGHPMGQMLHGRSVFDADQIAYGVSAQFAVPTWKP